MSSRHSLAGNCAILALFCLRGKQSALRLFLVFEVGLSFTAFAQPHSPPQTHPPRAHIPAAAFRPLSATDVAKFAAHLRNVPADPGNPLYLCGALLDEGLKDDNQTSFSQEDFNESQHVFCDTAYNSLSDASSLKANGGLDIPGTLGLTGSDAQSESSYSQAFHNYCGAGYEQVKGSMTLMTIARRVNSALVGQFSHCIDTLAYLPVRYITPSREGAGFSVYLEWRGGNRTTLTIDGIDIFDEVDQHDYDISSCWQNGVPLVKGQASISSSGSTADYLQEAQGR